MAEVLLVNPSSEATDVRNRRLTRVLYPPPPGGLASVAAALRAVGHGVRIVDLVAEPMPIDRVLEEARARPPDAVGYSVLGPALAATQRLARRFGDAFASVRQFAGNALPSEYPEWFLEQVPELDAVVIGEGEVTAAALLEAGFRGDVPGALLRGQPLARFRPRPQIEDLDALPFPAWDLLPVARYRASPQLLFRSRPTLGLLQSRGCPWRCSFCAQNYAWPSVRCRSIGSIGEEIERNLRDTGVSHYGFYDSIFPQKREYGEELYRELERRRLLGKVRLFCETRVDMVWEETFRWLERAGMHLVFLGIESPNADVLRRADKVRSMYDIERAVATLHRLGLRSYGLFVIGMPGQSASDYEAVGGLARRLPLDVASFGIQTRYPGAYGVRAEMNVDPASLTSVNWGEGNAELDRVQRRLMRAFYLRPRVIARHLWRREISLGRLAAGAVSLLGSASARASSTERRPSFDLTPGG